MYEAFVGETTRSYLKAETVHFEEHLAGEEDNEEQVGDLLEVVEPRRLAIVLRRQDARVEEDEDDDQPEHALRLDGAAAGPTRSPVELVKGLLLLLVPRVGLGDAHVFTGLRLGVAGQLRCNSN